MEKTRLLVSKRFENLDRLPVILNYSHSFLFSNSNVEETSNLKVLQVQSDP